MTLNKILKYTIMYLLGE